jgi:hypothetical protein
MPAGGLSARQISRLLKEHGSHDAAIEARPELADDLRRAQRHSEQLGKQFKGLADAAARASENLRVSALRPAGRPEMPSYEAIARARFERDVRAYETALARHARAEARKRAEKVTKRTELSDKQKLLHKHYRRATFAQVLALLDQGARPSAIARETGLKRQDVDKIRLWRDAEVYDVLSGQIPNTVILVRRPKTA